MLLTDALDHEHVGTVEMCWESRTPGRCKVKVAVAASDEMPLDARDQFTEPRIESVGISNAYRCATPQIIRDDVEIVIAGLTLLIDELSQVLSIEYVDIRRESIFLAQQMLKSGQAENAVE